LDGGLVLAEPRFPCDADDIKESSLIHTIPVSWTSMHEIILPPINTPIDRPQVTNITDHVLDNWKDNIKVYGQLPKSVHGYSDSMNSNMDDQSELHSWVIREVTADSPILWVWIVLLTIALVAVCYEVRRLHLLVPTLMPTFIPMADAQEIRQSFTCNVPWHVELVLYLIFFMLVILYLPILWKILRGIAYACYAQIQRRGNNNNSPNRQSFHPRERVTLESNMSLNSNHRANNSPYSSPLVQTVDQRAANTHGVSFASQN